MQNLDILHKLNHIIKLKDNIRKILKIDINLNKKKLYSNLHLLLQLLNNLQENIFKEGIKIQGLLKYWRIYNFGRLLVKILKLIEESLNFLNKI